MSLWSSGEDSTFQRSYLLVPFWVGELLSHNLRGTEQHMVLENLTISIQKTQQQLTMPCTIYKNQLKMVH